MPRIGGLGVITAIRRRGKPEGLRVLEQPTGSNTQFWLVVACGLPAFLVGITEDLTKNRLGPLAPARYLRLGGTGHLAARRVILRTDIPGVDSLITMLPFAIALTLLCVTGVANAINIIDGFNGLASMCVLMMLLGIAYVAFRPVTSSWRARRSSGRRGARLLRVELSRRLDLPRRRRRLLHRLCGVAELSVLLLGRNP